jgi:hypothetical protein
MELLQLPSDDSTGSVAYSGNGSVNCVWNSSSYEEIKPYADFTIKCGNDVYHVHRVVLAPQSDYFRNGFKAGFKVNLIGLE